MSSRRLRLAVPLAALALAAPACGFKSEPVGALPSFPRTAQDGQAEVTVDAQPSRIVSLDPGLTESAFAVGAGADVVAASGTESYPPAARRLPVALDSSGRPEETQIRKLNPDLILAPAALAGWRPRWRRAARPRLRRRRRHVHDIEHDIAQVGVLTGFAVRGGRSSGTCRSVWWRPPRGRRRAARAGVRRQRFFYTIDPAGPAGDLITLAGGVDVAADADPGKPYPLSKLRAAPPQASLAVAGRGTTLPACGRAARPSTCPRCGPAGSS